MDLGEIYRRSGGRLELLRELDSMLDFAKSTIQLELILYLGQRSKGIRPRDAARELRIKVKSVYDALSKLISKGLVTRTSSGTYVLTEEGRQFVKKLSTFFSAPQTTSTLNTFTNAPRVSLGTLTISKNVLFYKYIYDAMMVLGLSQSKELSIKDLARVVGVSESTLASYLDVVTARRGQTGLFRRVVRSRGNGKNEVFYRLTEFGYQELSRFSEYRKLKGNKVAMGLLRLTKSLTIHEAVNKLTTLSTVTAFLGAIAYALSSFKVFIVVFVLATLVGLLPIAVMPLSRR